MKNLTKQIAFLAMLVAVLGPAARGFGPPNPGVQKKPLENSDIINMIRAGLGSDVVISTINASDDQFDTSPEALIKLKQSRVPDAVIQAMILRGQPAAPAPSGADAGPQPGDPYVVVKGGSNTTILAAFPGVVETQAKGDSIATLAADSAINQIGTEAIGRAAAATAMHSVPIAGAIVDVGSTVLTSVGIGHKAVTSLYTLPGGQAATVTGNMPSFEVMFADVPNIDPEQFAPAIIRVTSTPQNWRLAFAQKTKKGFFQKDDQASSRLVEDVVPASATQIDKGHFRIRPQAGLAAGQYAVVIRPIGREFNLSGKDILNRANEGALLARVWDFTVR